MAQDGHTRVPRLACARMSDSLGTLCIVLHGHLPYVLHHGSYPHGEAWLYEAAAETYLPFLTWLVNVPSSRHGQR